MNFLKIILLGLLFTTQVFAGDINKGAISGGGGDIEQGELVSINALNKFVKKYAPSIIQAWFQHKDHALNYAVYNNYSDKYNSILNQLFSGNDIFSILVTLKIKIMSDGHCYDANNTPVDGSFNIINSDNIICISTFSISKKLTKTNYKKHILALIIHEISHAKGLDETKADTLQSKALEEFSKIDPMSIYSEIDHLGNKLSHAFQLIAELRGAADNDKLKVINYRRVNNHLYNLSQQIDNYLLGEVLLSKAGIFNHIYISRLQQEVARYYVCSVDASLTASSRKVCRSWGEELFEKSEKVTVLKYFAHVGLVLNDDEVRERHKFIFVYKIDSEEKFKNYLLKLKLSVETAVKDAQKLAQFRFDYI